MITNEKQYRTTRALVEKLRLSLADLDQTAGDLPPILLKAHREALDSQASELETDIAMYEDLRSGRVANFVAETLHDLPDILIRARIARGMTQKDLGAFLGIKEQQIQRYEAERYRSASLERLIEVGGALDVEIRGEAALIGDGRFKSVDPSVWTSFPITEMYKRGWFEDFSGSLAEAKKAAPQLVPNFLAATGADYIMPAMHRKSVRTKGKILEAAFTAWEARVRSLAEQNPPEAEFDPASINDEWIEALRAMSVEPDGVSRTVDHLRDIGISLIVERHLPGTLLDGAALCSTRKRAIVAMTLRHDRLDNFWFTLFHELGHLKLHVGIGQFAAIFDDTEAPADSEVEDEADLFAQEALIPAAQWTLAASRFARTERSVLVDAKRFGVGPAVIAGRIRRETRNYTLLSSLVGPGEVRRWFGL